jgi:hypothetical protein
LQPLIKHACKCLAIQNPITLQKKLSYENIILTLKFIINISHMLLQQKNLSRPLKFQQREGGERERERGRERERERALHIHTHTQPYKPKTK